MNKVPFSESISYMCRRHLRKSGISGNASAIPEMPGFSSIAKAFLENAIYLTMLKFWEMAQY